MFFIISKVLNFFFSPFSWIILLLLLSFFVKNIKWKKYSLSAALIMLFIFSNSFIFQEVVRNWELRAVKTLPQKYYVAVVLGGFSDYDFTLERINFYKSADRLFQTLPLYYNGDINKIMVSGGSGFLLIPEMKEGIFMRDYLASINFPMEDFILESESKNTYENALFTKQILEEKGLSDKKILLVTSASHMRRALACFEKAGLSCDYYVTDRKVDPNRNYLIQHYFIPELEILRAWDAIIHEWFGFVAYKAKGYI